MGTGPDTTAAAVQDRISAGSTIDSGDASGDGMYVRLPMLLRVFWSGSLVAFGMMIVIGYVRFRAGFPPPHYNPLGGSRYDDLLEYLPTFRLLHTAAFFHNHVTPSVAYPPFAAVLFAALYSFGRPVAVYLATAWVGLGVATWGVRKALVEHKIRRFTATLFPLTITVASFPILGLLQRGNIELLLWIFASCGIWAYLRHRDNAAAVLWALAGATKLYPLVFLLLLLPRRRYRAFALGVAAFVTVSVLSMWYLGPSTAVAFEGSLQNVFGYQEIRVGEWSLHELAANHSVFGLAKLAVIVGVGSTTTRMTIPYYACGVLIMLTVFFGRIRRLPEANQLLAVSVFMVMLPPVSYFYTLVHLYGPWLLLVFLAIRADQAGVRIRGLQRTLLLFLPLFASFMLFTYPSKLLFGGLIQACLLVLLFIYAVCFPFANPVTGAKKTT